jgi:hypothetical protein
MTGLDESSHKRRARASTGGAGTSRGVGRENLVLAWLTAHLVSHEHLPTDWDLGGTRLSAVTAQSGAEMDDLEAITDADGRLYVQSKHHLQRGRTPESPLSKALDQAVRQYREGVLEDDHRPLKPGRDLLVIVTDRAAPETVKRSLVSVVSRLSSLPPEKPLDSVVEDAETQTSFDVLLAAVHRSFAAATGGAPAGDADLRSFFQLLYVTVLELGPGEGHRVAAEERLRPILRESTKAGSAFAHLALLAGDLSGERRWNDAPRIRSYLRHHEIALHDDPRFSDDIQRLRSITQAVLGSVEPDFVIGAPGGDIRIERSVLDELRESQDHVALTGDAGSGKSAVAAKLARELLDAGNDVVYLTAEAHTRESRLVAGPHSTGWPREVLAGWDGDTPALLVVDGIDSSRGTADGRWLGALIPQLAETRWRVVATLRTHDLRNGDLWQRAFKGSPVNPVHSVEDLADVCHLVVGDLDDAEVVQVRDASPVLNSLFAQADDRLHRLLRNPFNLDIAASLLASDAAEVTAARSRLDLLDAYWGKRIRNVSGGTKRVKAIDQVVREMVTTRVTAVDALVAVDSDSLYAVEELAGVGVLRRIPIQYGSEELVRFTHPVLFDYAVSATILTKQDPVNLSALLDEDPNLVFRVWPSIELHLEGLWRRQPDREPFWKLVLRLASRPGGHPLAGVAAWFAVLIERPVVEDFAKFVAAADGQPSEVKLCLDHLSGALNAPDVLASERIAAVPVLSDLAAQLGEIAREVGDFSVADGVRMLLLGLGELVPLTPDAAGANARSRAACEVMRFAFADPSAELREQLARLDAGFLAQAAVVDPDLACPVIDDALAPEVMAHWGVSVIRSMLQHVHAIAAVRPEVAERILDTLWSFEETRQQAVGYGTQLQGLVTSRQGDLDTARRTASQYFPRLFPVAPEVAASVLVKALAIHRADTGPNAPLFPRIRLPGAIAPMPVHDDPLSQMEGQLVEWLAEASDKQDERVLPVLEQLDAGTNSEILWQAVFGAGATHPETFGRMALPILGKHLNIGKARAGDYVAAMSRVLNGGEHDALERTLLSLSVGNAPDGSGVEALQLALIERLDSAHVVRDETKALLSSRPAVYSNLTSAAPFAANAASPVTAFSVPAISSPRPPEIIQLRSDLERIRVGPREASNDALERIAMSFTGLVANHGTDPSLSESLTEAARLLAGKSDVLPDSEVGRAVLQVMLDAIGRAK